MKIHSASLHLALLLTAAVGFGQPAGAQPATTSAGARIDPRTGLPVGVNSARIDPLSGLPQNSGNGLPAEEQRRNQAERERLADHSVAAASAPDWAPLLQAQAYCQAGEYESALQCYQRACTQAEATRNASQLQVIFADWGVLGKKFPPARSALAKLCDEATQACLQGQDDFELFRKVIGINAALQDDKATVTLFKRIRQHQPARAEKWYGWAEPVLVRCGEYQLCLDCIGNPETRFQVRCAAFKRLQALNEDMSMHSQEAKRKAIEYMHQPGHPPGPAVSFSDPGQMALQHTRESFVQDVRNLIEILVGTGHLEVADQFSREAVAILDDPRLQTAVSDAKAQVQAHAASSAGGTTK